MTCREYLGPEGWCPLTPTEGAFCKEHEGQRRAWRAHMGIASDRDVRATVDVETTGGAL